MRDARDIREDLVEMKLSTGVTEVHRDEVGTCIGT